MLKVKKFRSVLCLLLGVIIGTVGTFTPQVLASYGETKTTVYYRDIKVNIDGTPTILTDLQGNPLEPVILFDTCYVPLSSVARALNRTAAYEHATRTVHINRRDSGSTVGTKPVKLTSMNVVEQHTSSIRWVYFEGILANNNSYIEDCWMVDKTFNDAGPFRRYTLNREYASMEGSFFLSLDGGNTPRTYKMVVYGDSKTLYESPDMKSGINPIKFNINLNDVKDIWIHIMRVGGSGNDIVTEVGLSNVTFYKYSYDD